VADRLVVGIGNPDRGDDAVGRLVAQALRARVPKDVRVVEQSGEATALLAELQPVRQAWLIDAAQSGALSGTIHRIDCSATDLAIPAGTVSSHGFSIAEALGLARALDVLPPQCILYAIEAADFAAGAIPSSAVKRAARNVVEHILAEIAIPPPPSSRPLNRAPGTDHR
jgi:hydrogenase maturation protease